MADTFESKHDSKFLALIGLANAVAFRDGEYIRARIAYVDPVTKTLWIEADSILAERDGQVCQMK